MFWKDVRRRPRKRTVRNPSLISFPFIHPSHLCFLRSFCSDSLSTYLTGTKASIIPKDLEAFLPPRRDVSLPSGRPLSEVGSMPIIHMRALMQGGQLSADLVHDVVSRYDQRQQQKKGGQQQHIGGEGDGIRREASSSSR